MRLQQRPWQVCDLWQAAALPVVILLSGMCTESIDSTVISGMLLQLSFIDKNNTEKHL